MPHDLGFYKASAFLSLLPSSYTPKGVVYYKPQVGRDDSVIAAYLG